MPECIYAHACSCTCPDDIYREDIAFKDPRNCIEGKKNYRTIFWSLRFHGALFFTQLTLKVQRIWQPEEALIR